MASTNACVILVTGGTGFLGQHLVGLLQEHADHVTEIRVLDVIPYENKLDYVAKKPVLQFIGSVTDYGVVEKACTGVDCVMHLASIVDTRLLPDEELSYKINVEGTQNVIAACHKTGVQRLVYCSTIEVVTGMSNIYDGTEDNTKPTENHLFAAYGPSKVEAERIIIQANCDSLKTMALRPSVLWGELDWRCIGRAVTSCLATRMGSYVRIDCKNGVAEHVYVGNVAWGFVCAENVLRENKAEPEATGSSYFITDDSPRKSMVDFIDPLMREIGLQPFRLTIPLWLCIYPLYILHLILRVVSLIYKVNFCVGIAPFASLTRIYLFKNEKARRNLNYKPLYSYEEAKTRTVKFYRLVLEARLGKT